MSIGTIVTIASYVSFALIILISFWVGFRRGVKRSAIYLGISFALILVAFFITAPISRAILGISVSVDGISKPISQIIVDTVSQEATIAAALESSPTLTSFLEVLPTFVINIVVFIILFIIMRLLAYIVYKIIECTCLKSKKKEKELGLKRNRWCGSLIGVAKAFLFIIIGFAPLSALLGFAEDLKTQTASTYTVSESNTQSTSIPTTDSLLNSVPVSVTDGIYSYNHNVYGVLCGIFNFDNFVFDNLTKINVAGENIAVRQDILNYATVYNTIAEITKAIQQPQGESFKDLDWIKMDKCVNQILESGLIKGLVTNLIGDFINNYSKFSQFDLSEYEKVLDKISSSFTNDTVKEYFLNDFKQVYSTVSCAGKSGILDTLIFDKDSSTQEKIEDVLSEENKDSLLKMISSILDMNILKDAISPILDLALTKVDSATFDFNSPNTEVSDWTSFKSSILNIIGGAIDINNTISIVSLIDNPISALNISTSKVDSLLIDLGKVLDNINSLSILTDKDGNKIVDKLCKKIGLSNILNVQGETSINNYSKLLNYLNPSIKKLLSFNLYSSLENEY